MCHSTNSYVSHRTPFPRPPVQPQPSPLLSLTAQAPTPVLHCHASAPGAFVPITISMRSKKWVALASLLDRRWSERRGQSHSTRGRYRRAACRHLRPCCSPSRWRGRGTSTCDARSPRRSSLVVMSTSQEKAALCSSPGQDKHALPCRGGSVGKGCEARETTVGTRGT
jgi:hypothetical protein